MRVQPIIRHLGDSAISVDFGNRIDPDITRQVLALSAAVAQNAPAGVIETVPTYRALLVVVDPVVADHARLCDLLAKLSRARLPVPQSGRLWDVPVVYGGDFGPDIETVAAQCSMAARAVADLHSAASYTVAMIGFLPGFCYLSGLEPRLAVPRRSEPRPSIPSSSISIGGAQTAIGSAAGPSGWHLIGRTPVRPFMQERDPVFLFAPGDRIRFVAVQAQDWARLDAQAATGAPVARLAAR